MQAIVLLSLALTVQANILKAVGGNIQEFTLLNDLTLFRTTTTVKSVTAFMQRRTGMGHTTLILMVCDFSVYFVLSRF